jgi:hypothetical protein
MRRPVFVKDPNASDTDNLHAYIRWMMEMQHWQAGYQGPSLVQQVREERSSTLTS